VETTIFVKEKATTFDADFSWNKKSVM
jgi:hypothetical protein